MMTMIAVASPMVIMAIITPGPQHWTMTFAFTTLLAVDATYHCRTESAILVESKNNCPTRS